MKPPLVKAIVVNQVKNFNGVEDGVKIIHELDQKVQVGSGQGHAVVQAPLCKRRFVSAISLTPFRKRIGVNQCKRSCGIAHCQFPSGWTCCKRLEPSSLQTAHTES